MTRGSGWGEQGVSGVGGSQSEPELAERLFESPLDGGAHSQLDTLHTTRANRASPRLCCVCFLPLPGSGLVPGPLGSHLPSARPRCRLPSARERPAVQGGEAEEGKALEVVLQVALVALTEWPGEAQLQVGQGAVGGMGGGGRGEWGGGVDVCAWQTLVCAHLLPVLVNRARPCSLLLLRGSDPVGDGVMAISEACGEGWAAAGVAGGGGGVWAIRRHSGCAACAPSARSGPSAVRCCSI